MANDPSAFFRDMLGRWEKAATQFGADATRSEEFARAIAAGATGQAAFQQQIEKAFAAANLPTKRDFEDISARLAKIEASARPPPPRTSPSLRAVANPRKRQADLHLADAETFDPVAAAQAEFERLLARNIIGPRIPHLPRPAVGTSPEDVLIERGTMRPIITIAAPTTYNACPCCCDGDHQPQLHLRSGAGAEPRRATPDRENVLRPIPGHAGRQSLPRIGATASLPKRMMSSPISRA